MGHTKEIELVDGSTAVPSAALETLNDDQGWSKHVVCIPKCHRSYFKV
jgi:hypothetical protein